MKHNREYEIAWQGLKPGPHKYQYLVDDAFMKAHEAPEEMHDWAASVSLTFDKHDSFFMLHFDIGGSVVLPCDRCGDDFTLHLWDEFDLLVKLEGDSNPDHLQDEEADVVFIPRNETVLDVSAWVYEFVMLSVPLHKVHPENEQGEPTCNRQALQLLQELSENDSDKKKSIWSGLENLKIEEETSTPNNNNTAKRVTTTKKK